METLESAPVLMAETAAEIGGGGEGLVVDLSVSVVPASENASSQQPFNPGEFEFNRRLLLNVLAYSVMCVVGAIGNAIVFVAAYRQHVSPENQVRKTGWCIITSAAHIRGKTWFYSASVQSVNVPRKVEGIITLFSREVLLNQSHSAIALMVSWDVCTSNVRNEGTFDERRLSGGGSFPSLGNVPRYEGSNVDLLAHIFQGLA